MKRITNLPPDERGGFSGGGLIDDAVDCFLVSVSSCSGNSCGSDLYRVRMFSINVRATSGIESFGSDVLNCEVWDVGDRSDFQAINAAMEPYRPFPLGIATKNQEGARTVINAAFAFAVKHSADVGGALSMMVRQSYQGGIKDGRREKLRQVMEALEIDQ